MPQTRRERQPQRKRRRSRRRARGRPLWLDLTLIALGVIIALTAIAAVCLGLYRQFYSPSAFVERYLSLLADGRAADALLVPGVTIDSVTLEQLGLSVNSSDVLLRRDALATLTEVQRVSEEPSGDTTLVTVSYQAGGHAGTTTFEVTAGDRVGFLPTWRFASSPLAVMQLTVTGSSDFIVNGFPLDKNQVYPPDLKLDQNQPLAMLVFTPGIYTIAVDNPVAQTSGVAMLSDRPLISIPVKVAAEPTEKFVAVVQDKVDAFLTACTAQRVLQPTGCPFGYSITDRVLGEPTWSVPKLPTVRLKPDGSSWRIPATESTARIEMTAQSLFDGSTYPVSEDVGFVMRANITVLADNSVAIEVSGRPILD